MKILVCLSKTPETTAKIAFSADGKSFDESGVQFIINPYDEWYALVRALELKEAEGGSVTVINVGPSSNDAFLRKALAIGGDEAIRVNTETDNALNIARQIAAVAKDEQYDAIFLGKETINHNRSEVGAMIAELLDLPFLSFASHLEVADGVAQVTRDIEGGVEVVEVALPIVLSASKGLAQQRIPNMRGIMMAKRKPLKAIEPIAVENHVTIFKYDLPPAKSSVKIVEPDQMDDLVRMLHEEAKVI